MKTILSRRIKNLLHLLEADGRRLHVLLMRVTLRTDIAEDLMQELFLKLSQSEAFDEAKRPSAYAARAAIHLAFDWRRAQLRSPPCGSLTSEPAERANEPVTRLIQGEDVERILNAVSRLPRLCRDAFVMHYIEQESYDMTAERLCKTPHQARALCSKAVGRIRKLIGVESRLSGKKEAPHA